MKAELSALLCDKYYTVATHAGKDTDPIRGQVVWVHGVYPPTFPIILRVNSYNGANPSLSSYTVKKYESGDQSHFPIPELQLGRDENYHLYVGKERPAVVIALLKSNWQNPLKEQVLVLVAPLFTFKPKHDANFITRVAAFEYPSLFYLPQSADGCSQEGAVRFELIQPVSRASMRNYFAGTPSNPIMLTNDAFALFANHLIRFLLNKDLDVAVCEQMDIFKQLVLDDLASQAKGSS